MEFKMFTIVIIGSVILTIILIVLFVVFKNKKNKKKVLNTSITIKKLKELNDKFPQINIDYNHTFTDCIHFKTRASVTNFKPDKYFLNFKTELSRVASIRMKNVYYYNRYKELFNETINKSITPDSVILQTKIKPSKYRKIEKEYCDSLFSRQLDSKEITYKINALYISPKGRNSFSSPYYSYSEKDFASAKTSFDLKLDYSPFLVENEDLNVKEEVEENVETDIFSNEVVIEEDINFVNDGVVYHIDDDKAIVIGIENHVINLVLNNKIEYKGIKYLVCFDKKAFLGNKTITNLTINEGIDCIEDSMFKNCVSLISISFPSSLKIIKKRAFSGCLKLKIVNIPSCVVSIEEEAFSLCGSLTDIYIPASIKNVGPSILWYSNKAKIHILSGNDISHFDPEWNVDNNVVSFE